MEEQINKIHEIIKNLYPSAASVNVLINSKGIEVIPVYKTNISGYSMQNISGDWIKKAE